MRLLLSNDRVVLFHGKSEHLTLAENSVDALVTDPPSGTGFMAKSWDKARGGRDRWIEWLASVLTPSFRSMKPGALGLVWALPRTSYWTGYALDEAGFWVLDRVSHLFLSGFPKSLTSKSAPIPDTCGTALKPAMEDWWLVQKPFKGTTHGNFTKYGTGLLNIDACRIGDANTHRVTGPHDAGWGMGAGVDSGSDHGRWPSHLVVSEGVEINDIEDPSQYFYCPKPPKSETEAGLKHLPVQSGGVLTGREDGSLGLNNPRAGAGRGGGRRNIHPTKKSIALMRWLIRLITPPSGIVLDPFSGSGTTGIAAIEEGRPFIGCEMGGDNDEYIPIFLGRIQHALSLKQNAESTASATSAGH